MKHFKVGDKVKSIAKDGFKLNHIGIISSISNRQWRPIEVKFVEHSLLMGYCFDCEELLKIKPRSKQLMFKFMYE